MVYILITPVFVRQLFMFDNTLLTLVLNKKIFNSNKDNNNFATGCV